MNILKKTLISALIVGLFATPRAHAAQSTCSAVEEIKLSDNPPTFVETVGYMALFLVTAYIMQKMIPPLPPAEAPESGLATNNNVQDADVHTLEAHNVYHDEYTEGSE